MLRCQATDSDKEKSNRKNLGSFHQNRALVKFFEQLTGAYKNYKVRNLRLWRQPTDSDCRRLRGRRAINRALAFCLKLLNHWYFFSTTDILFMFTPRHREASTSTRMIDSALSSAPSWTFWASCSNSPLSRTYRTTQRRFWDIWKARSDWIRTPLFGELRILSEWGWFSLKAWPFSFLFLMTRLFLEFLAHLLMKLRDGEIFVVFFDEISWCSRETIFLRDLKQKQLLSRLTWTAALAQHWPVRHPGGKTGNCAPRKFSKTCSKLH